MGIDRIVVVAGIMRIDGDERQVTQIFTPLQSRGLHLVGFRDHLIREFIGNAVLVNRDERDGARRGGVAQTRDDLRARQAHLAFRAGLLGLDQLTIRGTVHATFRHHPFLVRPLVDGNDPPAFVAFAVDAKDAACVLADPANEPRLVVVVAAIHLGHPTQQAVALFQRGIALLCHVQHARLVALPLPLQRVGEDVAVGRDLGHFEDRHGRQFVRIAIGLFPLFQMPLRLKLLEQALQVDPVLPLDAEGPRDIALGGLGRVLGNPREDFLFAGNTCHVIGVSRRHEAVSRKVVRDPRPYRRHPAKAGRQAAGRSPTCRTGRFP